MPKSESSSTKSLKKFCFDKDILDKSARQTFKIRNIQMHQNRNIVFFGLKSKRVKYKKDKRSKKDKKS